MNDPNDQGENELLARIKAGDEEAFIRLYRQRQGAIFRFALQMSGSHSVAEDVTQEVFLALVQEIRHFDQARGSLAAYLYGIAHNLVSDHIRRGRLDSPVDQAESRIERATTPEEHPLAEMTRREACESLRQAVRALPERYREVVVLCELHEMNYEGAAKILRCPVGTVRSRLHRARDLLAKKMGAKNPEVAEEGVKRLKAARYAL